MRLASLCLGASFFCPALAAQLPSHEALQKAVDAARVAALEAQSGTLPDYIPALEKVDPALFGVAVVTVDGEVFHGGDTEHRFAIMSAAKPFTLALVLEQRGVDTVVEKIGVEPTGLPFDSLVALERHGDHSVNPMVNAGALAAVSLVDAQGPEDRWRQLLAWYRAFAGAELELMPEVYESVREGGYRNRAIANLLYSYGRLYADPEETRDVYNRQSSIGVTTRELAVMGATLANGGVNPVSGRSVVGEKSVAKVLAIMMTSGMYDGSGRWVFEVGLPAKSGVGGGIVAVSPGRLAIAAFSPRLDEAGNSVRAGVAIRRIVDDLDLSLFAPAK